MQVDYDGAVRIARLAAAFDWSWTVADVEPFCAAAGWRFEPFPKTSKTLSLQVTTDLAINRQDGLARASVLEVKRWRPSRTMLNDFSVYITDVTTVGDVDADLTDAFAGLTARLTSELAEPTRWATGDDDLDQEVGWELPKSVIVLSASYPVQSPPKPTGAIRLKLINPVYQAFNDAAAEYERLEEEDEG
ncbi:DUF6301 family protein (plasmid) [Nocardia sp. NBC_01377]|uniref:DUF6301 family protein n=1 Tax=Nocardia sp. NBC_01377 TaxID=2903595 RepID=UPI002F919ED2